jgi:AcrR family transcriptional regulator
MKSSDHPKATAGRPRSDAARDAILEAAFALLIERGYSGLALEAVARAAGAGKTTIYRWWAGKADLAVDAFFRATTDALRLPETASARDDFRHQITELADLLRGPRGVAMAAMLAGAQTDPVLARALAEKWLEPRRRWGFARMSRAQAAGELRPGVDAGAALAVLYGPLYAPLLFGQSVLDTATVERVLAIAFDGIFRDA